MIRRKIDVRDALKYSSIDTFRKKIRRVIEETKESHL